MSDTPILPAVVEAIQPFIDQGHLAGVTTLEEVLRVTRSD